MFISIWEKNMLSGISVMELNLINCKMFQVQPLGRAQQERRISCMFFSLFFPAHCFLKSRFAHRHCLLKELNYKNN